MHGTPRALDGAVASLMTRVERAMEEALRSDEPVVQAMARAAAFAGGKRLRPRLCVLAYLAAGGRPDGPDPERIVDAGVGLELVHAASLVHDDIVDEADTRRGEPTVSKTFGTSRALMAGDFLFVQAFSRAGRLGSKVVDSTARACRELVEGEVLELTHLHDSSLTPDGWERIARKKTASVLRAACEIGALVADPPPAHVQALSRYGELVGLAFQVADDLLDIEGHPLQTGKPQALDLRQGVVNLPVVYALQAPKSERLRELVEDGLHDEAAVREAVIEVRAAGGPAAAYDASGRYVARAIEALQALPASPARDELEAVARGSRERSS